MSDYEATSVQILGQSQDTPGPWSASLFRTGTGPRTWSPRTPGATPPNVELKDIPFALRAEFARQFNINACARRKRRLALVHGGVARVHVSDFEQPGMLAGMPPGSKLFTNYPAAQLAAFTANATALRYAVVPREWFVVAHVLNDQPTAVDSGEAGGEGVAA